MKKEDKPLLIRGMYRFSRKTSSKHLKTILFAGVFILILVGASLLIVPQLLRTHTTIKQSKAVVSVIPTAKIAKTVYDEGLFTIKLPSSWQAMPSEKQPYILYHWQIGANTSTYQQLAVYQDTIPQTLAVNHELEVTGNASRLSIVGIVSGSCTNLVTATEASSPGTLLATWQSVKFLCNITHNAYAVVGTGSGTSINSVTLDGPTSGTHTFFFTYTSPSNNTDYGVFYRALSSFQLK